MPGGTLLHIFQRVIPHYRVPLFRELYEKTGTRVFTARVPPAGTYLQLALPQDYEWAIPVDVHFPDPRQPYRAVVDLESILGTRGVKALIAEFGSRISTTYDLAGARASGRLGAFAFWTHGWQMDRGFSSPEDIAVQHFRVWQLGRADALGAYSEEGAAWLRRRLPNTPTVTLGNAIDTVAIQTAARASRERRKGHPQLLAVGRLTEDKNFALLLDVFATVGAQLPGAALTIIGDGPLRAELECRAAEICCGSVLFTGALHDEADLAPHFLGADLLVIPGAAGLSVNHALAYGLPVVAFKRTAAGPRHHPEIEYVRPRESGILVDRPTAASMATDLVSAIRNGAHIQLKEKLRHRSPAPDVQDVVSKFIELSSHLEEAAVEPRWKARRAMTVAASPRSTTPVFVEGPRPRIAFLWENFGPMHIDRCVAVGRAVGGADRILGIELAERSTTYQWEPATDHPFEKVTLARQGQRLGGVRLAFEIAKTCIRNRVEAAFLCHYELVPVFMAAVVLRLVGIKVFIMNDSKFDDYKRSLIREISKAIAHLPYSGGLAAGERSADYMRFLSQQNRPVARGYDSISIDRIRSASKQEAVQFAERDFLVVARLVAKKNISAAIQAFAIFRERATENRKLRICGSGPLDSNLRKEVAELGLEDHVLFHGFEPIETVAWRMSRALALLLPSYEEQFGLVICEALAVGTPTIISLNCGARDDLVRSGVNGFIVEPDNVKGMSVFMQMLSHNEELWRSMSAEAYSAAEGADVKYFAQGVCDLLREKSLLGRFCHAG